MAGQDAALVTIDVIDRPSAGARRRLRVLRRSRAPGVDALIAARTARFVARLRPAPTPRRIAVLTAWQPAADIEAAWPATLGAVAEGAREHWHIGGELVRAAFSEPWRGWTPQVDGAAPLADDEPALILISTDVSARDMLGFARNGALAVSHTAGRPGYLGGLVLNASLPNMTSCSAWRSYADARQYAFGSGGHAEAMRRDRLARPVRPEWFMRVRPLAERGTLNGAPVFAPFLMRAVA